MLKRGSGKLENIWRWLSGSLLLAPSGPVVVIPRMRLYLATWTGKSIQALTPDGKLKWEYPMEHFAEAKPALGPDGTIYVSGYDTNFYALSPSGGLLWKEKFGSRLTEPPAISPDGGVYLPSLDNHIYSMRTVESQADELSSEPEQHQPGQADKGTVEVQSSEVVIDGIRLKRKSGDS